MNEISLPQQDNPQANFQQQKQKFKSDKAAVRLIQKQQQQLIQKLSIHHNPSVINIVEYSQQKSELQKMLDIPSANRTKKILKAIKAQLSYLQCFQIQSYQQIPKELMAIMKRDLDMFMGIISKFVYAKVYPKGTILENIGDQRNSIKVLLRGEMLIFQPINYKSYKNCMKIKAENRNVISWLQSIIQFVKSLNKKKEDDGQKDMNHDDGWDSPQNEELKQTLKDHNKNLSPEQIRRILTRSNIITPRTPHKLTSKLYLPGGLISSQRQPYIISQLDSYLHSSICSAQSYVMQLEWPIYKAAISLLNSDQQKLYIQILLKRFEMMQYFDAKQYIKKQYMIDKNKQLQQSEKKLKQYNQKHGIILPKIQYQKQFWISTNPKQQQQSSQDQQKLKKKIVKKNLKEQQLVEQTYEIKCQQDIYLIITGQVTLKINKIQEIRLFNLEHASKIKNIKPCFILKLYPGDLFGFQNIGRIKEYDLTYVVNKSSKLLLMNQNIYIKHFQEIPGFRTFFKSIEHNRNVLIQDFLYNLQRTIETEQMKKYQSLEYVHSHRQKKSQQKNYSNKVQPLLSYNSTIRNVEYIGNKNFQKIQNKIREDMLKYKSDKINNLKFKDIIRNGSQLKDSLSFASIYRQYMPRNCQIKGNYIQIRDNKGNLQRKKFIIENKQSLNKGKEIFRKIGVISAEQRNVHNEALVINRKSKYKIDNFNEHGNEMKRLKQISVSLPKLGYLYAKKEQMLYKNMHKRQI